MSEELTQLELDKAPPAGFSFGEAVEVFLPAYLDVYPDNSSEWADAYRARALFRTRLIDAVDKVVVARNRDCLTLVLKNGISTELQVSKDFEFGVASDYLTEVELKEVDAERSKQLARARQMTVMMPSAQ